MQSIADIFVIALVFPSKLCHFLLYKTDFCKLKGFYKKQISKKKYIYMENT